VGAGFEKLPQPPGGERNGVRACNADDVKTLRAGKSGKRGRNRGGT
jgi:hypothetical protein